MDHLPSYEAAVTRPDWLALVAPYISTRDYRACTLTSRNFYRHTAPLLWEDPLVAVRDLGLDPNDDLIWYRRFIQSAASKGVRPQTRTYVRSLDFRHFALRASGLYSTEASERAISESFRILLDLFPNLQCLLLDGHPELDPGHLATRSPSSLSSPQNSSSGSLQLLDLARCRHELSVKVFASPHFQGLTYLDISYIPGSIKSAVQHSLNPAFLPSLTVLKARGREMDDETARFLLRSFGAQLWSLDVSDNKLTDLIIDDLINSCSYTPSLRSGLHFETEGRLVRPKNFGTRDYGPFDFIEESEYSADFRHPHRHLSDVPIYSPRGVEELQEWQAVRSTGREPLIKDDAGAIKRQLLNSSSTSVAETGRTGITHLYLNQNPRLTCRGLSRLIRLSSGQIQHLECDKPLFVISSCSSSSPHPRDLQISGHISTSHLFRPLISSNLRSLRLHHSIVTGVPCVTASEGLSAKTAARYAEKILYKRIVCRAFENGLLTPDTNPRIVSLTLTHIPTRSRGPVIEGLIRLLRLARNQEREIMLAARNKGSSGRGTVILSGLRHIRLEMDDDDEMTEGEGEGDEDDDYDKLLDPGDSGFGIVQQEEFSHSGGKRNNKEGTGDFSFFEDGFTSSTNSKNNDTQNRSFAGSSSTSSAQKWTTGLLQSPPYKDNDGIRNTTGYINYRPASPERESWTGGMFSAPVWVGSGGLVSLPSATGTAAAINEYMWNLQDPSLRLGEDIEPAPPGLCRGLISGEGGHGGDGETNHALSPVLPPKNALIFKGGWNAIVSKPGKVGRDDVARMVAAEKAASSSSSSADGNWKQQARAQDEKLRDVATEIKRFRIETRGTDGFWGGKVELVRG